MEALFITDKSKFPHTISGETFNPRPFGEGWIFSLDKQTLLESLNVDFQVIEFSAEEAPSHVTCIRCQMEYDGQLVNEDGKCRYCVVAVDEEKARFQRQTRIDYLKGSAKGTAVEEYVSSLFERYSQQVNVYVETGSSILVDAIDTEAEQPWLTYLNIQLPDGKVKDRIKAELI